MQYSFPGYYYGLPVYWRDEQSGVLSGAINAFLESRVNKTPMTEEEISMVRGYCEYYIAAPCLYWESTYEEELAALRASIKEAKTSDDLARWTEQALAIGIDPL
jgi:hypothetical protein